MAANSAEASVQTKWSSCKAHLEDDNVRFYFGEFWSSEHYCTCRVSRRALVVAIGILLLLTCVTVAIVCALLSSGAFSDAGYECLSPGCFQRAAEMSQMLNSSVSPCQNFYQYACANFEQTYPLGDHFTYGMMDAVQERNMLKLEQLLIHHGSHKKESALNKLRIFYQTCMYAGHTKPHSLQPYVDEVLLLGGWDLFDNFDAGKWNFYRSFNKTSNTHSILLFFRLVSEDNPLQLRLQTPEFGIFTPSSLGDNDYVLKRQKEYHRLLISITTELQRQYAQELPLNTTSCGSACDPVTVADDVVAIETAISSLHVDYGKSELITFDEIDKLMPVFEMSRWIREKDVLPDGFDGSMKMSVPSREYLTGLQQIVENMNASSMNNYFMWSMTHRYLNAMGPTLSALGQQLDLVDYGYPQSRKEYCYQLVRRYMSTAVHGLFILKHIETDNVFAKVELLQRINETLLDSLSWMSDKDRAKALVTMSNWTTVKDHSDLVHNETNLDIIYTHLKVEEYEFLKNLKNIYAFQVPSSFRGRQKEFRNSVPFDSHRTDGLPYLTYVGMIRRTNQIAIPTAVLQPPLFDHDLPDSINFASLGSLLLRKLVQIFYMESNYNSPAALWDDHSLRRYGNYHRCEMDNFESYRIDEEDSLSEQDPTGNLSRKPSKLEPKNSASYLVSQHLSFLLSYRMFQKSGSRTKQTLPGLKMSPEQLFYLAFAQMRCRSNSQDNGIWIYRFFGEFPHAQMINNFMYNWPPFLQAFQCDSTPAQHTGRTCKLDTW